MVLDLAGQYDLRVFVCMLQEERHASQQNRAVAQCLPCNVFNGPSTHSASLVRMMLIAVQHPATLPCCSSAPHTHNLNH